ncbi:MAG: HAD-IIB family hydrolase [Kurthia sp.]|nr:HAD-IIB family hydrolase [Candidatus Kurthia equi]
MKFVFDLDGTICFKGKPLTDEILEAFQQVEADGHAIIIASARPIRDIYPVLTKSYYALSMVGGNGAFIFDGEKIEVQAFSQETRQILEQLFKEGNLRYLVDGAWDYSYTGPEHHPIFQQLDALKLAQNSSFESLEEIVKCVLFTQDINVLKQLQQVDVVIHVHGEEGILDISPSGVHKATGLMRLGIEPGTYIAFGNDENDFHMLQQAKVAVCVGTNDKLQKIAHHICDEQSVADRIRSLSSQYK